MIIVWKVKGKIIRSVMCSVVCNNCAQCNAHTHMNRPNSCLLVRFSFFGTTSAIVACGGITDTSDPTLRH